MPSSTSKEDLVNTVSANGVIAQDITQNRYDEALVRLSTMSTILLDDENLDENTKNDVSIIFRITQRLLNELH